MADFHPYFLGYARAIFYATFLLMKKSTNSKTIKVGRSIVLGLILYQFSLLLSGSDLPSIKTVNYNGAGSIVLKGERFNTQCKQCEVLVKYSRLIEYSVDVKSWNNNKIIASLPDLNQNEDMVKIQIRSGRYRSKSIPHKLRRVVSLKRKLQRDHSLSVGEKGEDKFEVGTKSPVCGNDTNVFDHANLSIKKKRYADAVLVHSPRSGCTTCDPITVRWFNEPTGKIKYDLLIYERKISGACKNKIRS